MKYPKKVIKFHLGGANGSIDPRERKSSSNINCPTCQVKWTFWDDLCLSPMDEEFICAKCKNIHIEIK